MRLSGPTRWLLDRLLGRRTKASATDSSAEPEPEPLTVGARAMTLELANVVAVARREYLSRSRTRTFRITTVLLLVAALGLALAPILIRWVGQGSGPARIEVALGDSAPKVDVVGQISALLNAQSGSDSLSTGGKPDYVVTATTDVPGARARVDSGQDVGLLIVTRAPASASSGAGDLAFTFVTKAQAVDRISGIMKIAATSACQSDRLARAGITPVDQAKLFAAASYTAELPSGEASSGGTAEDFLNQFAMGFVLSIVLFMAIILYGQWVAYSVAEEKSSRVMEVILGAASPFELLAGKVIGVGGLALTQYAVIFLPALAVLLLQDQIAGLLLHETAAAASLPPGLTVELLVTFGVLFVLGFGLYSVLYAGAAALVSRTEDINNIVAPLTMVSTAGYLVAVWSSTGLFAPDSPLVRVMSYIPFFSPYLILARMGNGSMGPLEVIAAIVILAVSVPLALWFAARLYAAGVLMYGQRPSLRLFVRVFRRA
ncbi:MAG TPA: ABC transporter permease [Candidatus Limnocylindrales bacterium]|nr:ABC transporter permease [Candidatus Limnocylindrales bacterium]